MIRRAAKRALEVLLVRGGVASVLSSVMTTRRLILAYHNVVPSGDPRMGDSSLHLPLAEFERQLDLLSEAVHFVPLADLLVRPDADRQLVGAVTFDDAYQGTLRLALPALERRGIPSTLFVAPGLLGSEGFWWDRLADPESGEIQPDVRSHALKRLGGRQEEVLEWADREGRLGGPLPSGYLPGTEEDVAAARSPLVSLGSHTWSHPNLALAPPEDALDELARSQAWLTRITGDQAGVLSYPYGISSVSLHDTVRKAGFEFALKVAGGLVPVRDLTRNPLAIPRVNIPRGLTNEGFLARILGVWPS